MTPTKIIILIVFVLAIILPFRLATMSNTSPASIPDTTQTKPVSPAPAISEVSVASITESTAAISWKTSAPCTSRVLFKTDSGGPANRDVSTGLSLTHSITLTSLQSGQKYYITLECQDTNGNLSKLDRTFTTLRRLKIAYVSLINGRDQIYCMNADGTDRKALSNGNSRDFSPSWSPDGKKIAFDSNRDGNYQIYVMNADGSNQTQLTHDSYDNKHAVWSPR